MFKTLKSLVDSVVINVGRAGNVFESFQQNVSGG
jgi:hypothetical protein